MSEPMPAAFSEHLREAISLNRERMPRYAALTDGRSLGISRRLITSERLTLPAAWYLDRRARPFQAAGVGVVRDDFVPMRTVPDFRDSFDPPTLTEFRRQDAAALTTRLRDAWRTRDFHGLRDVTNREIEWLEDEPRFHCMLRHMLESLRRIAHLAPRHDAAARAAGIGSTRPLSALLTRMHLLALPTASGWDHRAAPLQAEGVPILFQDLPDIPMEDG